MIKASLSNSSSMTATHAHIVVMQREICPIEQILLRMLFHMSEAASRFGA